MYIKILSLSNTHTQTNINQTLKRQIHMLLEFPCIGLFYMDFAEHINYVA